MGKDKSKKRKHSCSESTSSSSSGSDAKEKKKIRQLKKKLKKEQKRVDRALRKQQKEEKKKLKKSRTSSESNHAEIAEKADEVSSDIPLELMEKSKAMAPMTKEEWEKRQSVVRRVLDEDTGRYRLIKGDGEVLEEIVSRNRHMEINRQATSADGVFFQSQTIPNKCL